MQLSILENGSSELVKAVVHGMSLSLVAVMGAYNLAAWLQRRQRHLAFNALVYAALVLFEYQHVCHHRASLSAAVGAAALAATATTATVSAASEPVQREAA